MQLKNGYKLIYEKADSNGDLHMYASKYATPTNDDETISIQGLDGAVMGHEADYPINVTYFNGYPYASFPIVEEGVKSLAGLMQYAVISTPAENLGDLTQGSITTIGVNVKTVDCFGHRYYCVQHADTAHSDGYYAPVMFYGQVDQSGEIQAESYSLDYYYWDDSTGAVAHSAMQAPAEDTAIAADNYKGYGILPGGDKWLIVHRAMRIPVYQWYINVDEETTEATLTADQKIVYGPAHFEDGTTISFTTDRLFMGYDDLAEGLDEDAQAHISRGQNGEITVHSASDSDKLKFIVDTHGKIMAEYFDEYHTPMAYQEVEYLKSEAGNAYFQVPYDFASDTDTFDVVMEDNATDSYSSSSYYYFGSDNSFNEYFYHYTNNNMRARLSGPGTLTLCACIRNTKLRVRITPTSSSVENYDTGTSYGTATYSRYNYTGSTHFEVFNVGTNTAAIMTLYSMKVFRDETITSNLIPCYRKSDNVVGLYDAVRRIFITKTGSGTIIAGPEITDGSEE